MAYGFKDCCNSSNYFYLSGIPATVQENEIFLIETLQGETFCATYVKIPSVNYSIPTYNLVTLTQKTSCSNCNSSNPCPTTQEIFLSQFGAGTIATSTDCFLKTVFPIVATCSCVTPTANGASDGKLGLIVVGGVPPYIFYEQGDALNNNAVPYSSTFGTLANQYILASNLPSGSYPITITDSGGNFYEDITCIIDEPPPTQVVTCGTGVSPSYTNLWSTNGSLSVTITDGVAPFTIKIGATTYHSNVQEGTYTLSPLASGTYTVTIISSTYVSPLGVSYAATTVNKNCTVPSPSATITYPTQFCFKFKLCEQVFSLNLVQASTQYNNRPQYQFDANAQSAIGGAASFLIRWEDNTQGWESVAGTIVPTNINFINDPGVGCSLTVTSFKLNSAKTSGTVQLQDKPQDYTWSFASTSLNTATNLSFTEGACVLTAASIQILPSSILFSCASSYLISTMTVNINITGEQPNATFTYYYKKTNVSNFTSTNSSTITFSNATSDTFGDYQIYAVDTTNNLTTPTINFTLSQQCLPLGVAQVMAKVCPDTSCYRADGTGFFIVTSQQVVDSVALFSPEFLPPFTLFWRKQGQQNFLSLPLPEDIFQGQGTGNYGADVTIYGSQVCSQQNGNGDNYGAGNYEFYLQDNNGMTSALITRDAIEIPCYDYPALESPKMVYDCALNGYVIQYYIYGGQFPMTISIENVSDTFTLQTPSNDNTYILQNASPAWASLNMTISDAQGNTSAVQIGSVDDPNVIVFNFTYDTPLQYNLGNPGDDFNTDLYDGNLPGVQYNPGSIGAPTDEGGWELPFIQNNAIVPSFDKDLSRFNIAYSSSLNFYTLNYEVSGINNNETLKGYFEIELNITNQYTFQNPMYLYPFDLYLNQHVGSNTVSYFDGIKDMNQVLSDPLNTEYFLDYAWIGHVYPGQTGFETITLPMGGFSAQIPLRGFYLPNGQRPTADVYPQNYSRQPAGVPQTLDPQIQSVPGFAAKNWDGITDASKYKYTSAEYNSDPTNGIYPINSASKKPLNDVDYLRDVGQLPYIDARTSNIYSNLGDQVGDMLVKIRKQPQGQLPSSLEQNSWYFLVNTPVTITNQSGTADYTLNDNEIDFPTKKNRMYEGKTTVKRRFKYGSSESPITITNGDEGKIEYTFKGAFYNAGYPREPRLHPITNEIICKPHTHVGKKYITATIRFYPVDIPPCKDRDGNVIAGSYKTIILGTETYADAAPGQPLEVSFTYQQINRGNAYTGNDCTTYTINPTNELPSTTTINGATPSDD